VRGNAADIVADHFALARMKPGAKLMPSGLISSAIAQRKGHGPSGRAGSDACAIGEKCDRCHSLNFQ
jgi:hypothetical protein